VGFNRHAVVEVVSETSDLGWATRIARPFKSSSVDFRMWMHYRFTMRITVMFWLAWLGLLVAATSCVTSAATECGILHCPVNSQCAIVSTGPACVTQEDVAACANAIDGAPCNSNGRAGICDSALCVTADCGNQIREASEDCDGSVSDTSCTAYGYYTGTVACSAACRFDFSACSGRCGDGNRNGAERCDGTDLGGASCESLRQYPGALDCDLACGYNLAQCGGRCGDGTVQATMGERCDDGNTSSGDGCSYDCLSDEKCGNGVVDFVAGEQCDGASNCRPPGGLGACLLQRCGNTFVEAGEICDDGNTVGSDGCSADCRSNEMCGNGIVDAALGEQCDDNGLRGLSNDGCSSQCTVESDTWQHISPTDITQRSGQLAYDSVRQRIVLFGGHSGSTLMGETWEFDGTAWLRRETVGAPTPRDGHAMTFDSHRRKVVLFGGGDDNNVLFGETWEYDGYQWRKITTALSPSARRSAAMAYDSLRQRVVLTGGNTGGETWEYDGITWQRITSAPAPSVNQSAMAYDSIRHRMVLFGGIDNANQQVSDTYTYDGSTWTKQSPTTSPPARLVATMGFDSNRGRMVIFGGYDPQFRNDTWEYNGTTWIDRTTIGPSPRQTSGVYDEAHSCFVVFSGFGATAADTWQWNGTVWTLVSPQAFPVARNGAMFATDTRRGVALLYGGYSNGFLDDTWEFDGASWRARAGALRPSARVLSGLAFDSKRNVFVLFGGNFNGAAFGDTWEFSAGGWRLQTTVHAPPPRYGHAMAFDSKHGNIVVFGGYDGAAGLSDTWEYNGSDWVKATTATTPAPRYYVRMAYDEDRERMVMFGGQGTDRLADTWEYDGQDWHSIATTVAPSKRDSAPLAYNPSRRAITLFGGSAPGLLADTWEYNGSNWSQRAPSISVTARVAAMATDPVHHRVLLFGGYAANGNQSDIYAYGFASTSVPADDCVSDRDTDGDGLIGCTDPDCHARCAPLCPLSASGAGCPVAPTCGDASCAPELETAVCSADCGL
jgi:cysteine-rich repeat protein